MSLEKKVGGVMMIFGLIMFFLSLYFMFQISYWIPEVEKGMIAQSQFISESMNSASITLNEASSSISSVFNLMSTMSLGFESLANSMKNLSRIFNDSPLLSQLAKGSDELFNSQSEDFNVMSKELLATKKSLGNSNEKVKQLSSKIFQISEKAKLLPLNTKIYLNSIKWSLYALFGYLAIINFLLALIGYHLTTSPGIIKKNP